MTAYVYIIPHRDEPRMKIGKAVNVSARLRQIGAHLFAPPHCLLLRFCNEQAALRAESILHRTFARWWVDPVSMNGGLKGRDGNTEWFDNACRDRLDQFLLANMDLLEAELVHQDSIEQVLGTLTRPRFVPRPARKTTSADRSVQNISWMTELRDEEVEVLARPVIDRVAIGLTELAQMCDRISLVEESTQPRRRDVVGSAPVPLDVFTRHVMNLMHESDVPTNNYMGSIRVVTGGIFEAGESIDFEVSLVGPGATEGRSPQVDRLIESVFEYPVPITGWPSPAS